MNLKDKYLHFFANKQHTIIPSASILPENDPTCLFTTAGMHPLVPYLLGEKHPSGNRLVNYQCCLRLTDIEEVGDKTHHTFFEMLGNWSLGNYFKEESIKWSYEFLSDILKIPVERIGVTVFSGNSNSPRDEVSSSVWKQLGFRDERILFLEDNWWGPAGETGPCGPCTEIFYWSDNSVSAPLVFDIADNRWVEIWNNVFMEFNKTGINQFVPLIQKNVDTGMGVERVTALLENVDDNYQTEIFKPIITKIEELSGKSYHNETHKKSMRILADHIRSIVMLAGDKKGLTPSNSDQGYVLRRLIRRFTRYSKMLGIDIQSNYDELLAQIVISQLSPYYADLKENTSTIIRTLQNEKNKFSKTLEKGMKEFEKVVKELAARNENLIPGDVAFRLYDTFGFPIELTTELANESSLNVDIQSFHTYFAKHQALSRLGSEQKFKGGLADNTQQTTRLHTATHLLLAALRKVLNEDITQKGSNITSERLRFDFSFARKLTAEELGLIENFVNTAISQNLPIHCEEMPINEAKQRGAIGVFNDRYNDIVKVYSIGDVSKEICGGPHAKSTAELVNFKIQKEEASSAGVRRIKATLIYNQQEKD